MDKLALIKKTFKIADLEKRYQNFVTPSFKVIIDSTDVEQKEMMGIGELMVENSVDKADYCSFKVENAYEIEKRSFKWVDDYFVVGKPIVIKMGYVDKYETVFEGVISQVTLEIEEGDYPDILIEAMDRSVLMMTGEKTRIWYEKKHSDVVKEIAGLYKLSAKMTPTKIQFETIVQNDMTDFEFIQKLALLNGYEFFIVGKELHFRPLNAEKKSLMTLSVQDNLISLVTKSTINQQWSSVTVKGFNYKQEEIEGTSGNITALGSGKLTGGEIIKKLGKEAGEHVVHGAFSTMEEAEIVAQGLMERQSMYFLGGYGKTVGIPELRAGHNIEFYGFWGKNKKMYYIVDTRHSMDEEGYSVEFSLGGNKL